MYMCMCVCVYIYIHICVCVCVYIYIYVCVCVCIYMCIYIYMCVCVYVYIYIYACVCVKICAQKQPPATHESLASTPHMHCSIASTQSIPTPFEMNSLEVLGQSVLSSLTALPENLLPSVVPATVGTDLPVPVQILMQCLSNVFT